MTVINMMSFGDSGAAVADEQSSTSLRKYNIASKLPLINGNCIYGGSGPADFLKMAYDQACALVMNEDKGKRSLEMAYNAVNKVLLGMKNAKKSEVLYANVGITLDELLTGVFEKTGKPLDESTKSTGRNVLQQLDKELNAGIVLGGLGSNGFEIYTVDTGAGGFKISRPYHSVGSGSDESDKVLSGYIAHLPRDRRENIDPIEGLIKLIEATNAAVTMNVGVGGNHFVRYINKGNEVLTPSENSCILASEIVEGNRRRLLGETFTRDAISKLIIKAEDFRPIEKSMRETAGKNWEKFCMGLRGYK